MKPVTLVGRLFHARAAITWMMTLMMMSYDLHYCRDADIMWSLVRHIVIRVDWEQDAHCNHTLACWYGWSEKQAGNKTAGLKACVVNFLDCVDGLHDEGGWGWRRMHVIRWSRKSWNVESVDRLTDINFKCIHIYFLKVPVSLTWATALHWLHDKTIL